MRGKHEPQSIASVVQQVVDKLTQEKRTRGTTLPALWRSAAGQELGRHSRALGVKKGTLWVHVEDSAWLYQANLKKDAILTQVKNSKGYEDVKLLHLRIGKI